MRGLSAAMSLALIHARVYDPSTFNRLLKRGQLRLELEPAC
jgi:hypothetical protein